MRTKEAIGLVAKEMACKKNELYEAYHKRVIRNWIGSTKSWL